MRRSSLSLSPTTPFFLSWSLTLESRILAVFPGLLESINAKDYPNAIKWAAIIDNCLQDSVKLLKK